MNNNNILFELFSMIISEQNSNRIKLYKRTKNFLVYKISNIDEFYKLRGNIANSVWNSSEIERLLKSSSEVFIFSDTDSHEKYLTNSTVEYSIDEFGRKSETPNEIYNLFSNPGNFEIIKITDGKFFKSESMKTKWEKVFKRNEELIDKVFDKNGFVYIIHDLSTDENNIIFPKTNYKFMYSESGEKPEIPKEILDFLLEK